MRRLVVLAAALALALALAPAGAATTLRTLTGTVTSGVDDTPIEGMRVCVGSTAAASGAERCTTSAADGTYTLPAAQGRNQVTVEDPSLFGDWVDQRWPGRTVTVTSGGARADLRMRPGARVRLWLTATDRPIEPFMSVAAYRVAADGTIASTETSFGNLSRGPDRSRVYGEVAKLPAGTWVLRMEWNQPGGSHAQAWYPNSATARDAQRITLAEGEDLTLDDMPLQPPGTLAITAKGPDGRPAKVAVALFDDAGRAVPGHLLASTTRANVTTLRGLPSGTYRFRVVENTRTTRYKQWHPSAPSFAQAGLVKVRGGATTSVTTTLRYRTPKRVSPPRTRHRGYGLTVTTMPRWSPMPTRQQVRWFRDGKATDSIGRAYAVERRDVGHRLQACVTGYRTGWATVTYCSAPYRPKDTWHE